MRDIQMCQQVKVHVNMPYSEMNINSLVSYCKNVSKSFFQELFQAIIIEFQQRVLTSVLGERWRPSQPDPASWHCPCCESRYGFKRRGRRQRSLKTSHGTVHFGVLQVTCCDCGKTFSPFPKILGIAHGHRITQEFEQLICHVVKDVSYGKTSQLFAQIADAPVSPHTAHRVVQKYGKKAEIIENNTAIDQVQYDSTKIKASANKRGLDVHLAIAIGQRSQHHHRTHWEKTLVNVQVSRSPSQMKKILKNTPIGQLAVDGLSGLTGYINKKKLAVPVQRCLWHIPRTVSHMLYLDGVDKEQRRELVRPLKHFLFDENRSVDERLRDYQKTIQAFAVCQYENTVHFLTKAMPYLFTYKINKSKNKNKDKNIIYERTISIIEHLMREINRRCENGAHWTPEGAENLLTVKLIEELNNPQSYDYLWKLKKQTKATFQVILC